MTSLWRMTSCRRNEAAAHLQFGCVLPVAAAGAPRWRRESPPTSRHLPTRIESINRVSDIWFALLKWKLKLIIQLVPICSLFSWCLVAFINYRVGQKNWPFLKVYDSCIWRRRKAFSIKTFSSLSGVKMVFWMWPYLNILCISSEKRY